MMRIADAVQIIDLSRNSEGQEGPEQLPTTPVLQETMDLFQEEVADSLALGDYVSVEAPPNQMKRPTGVEALDAMKIQVPFKESLIEWREDTGRVGAVVRWEGEDTSSKKYVPIAERREGLSESIQMTLLAYDKHIKAVGTSFPFCVELRREPGWTAWQAGFTCAFEWEGLTGSPRTVLSPSMKSTLLHTALSVLGFFEILNCRNVVLRESAAAEGLRKMREKKGAPCTRYKKLVVDNRLFRGGEKKEQMDFDVMPLHLQRGHIKTYDEKPLFGQYKGAFWWQPHMRGKKQNGKVIKVYDATQLGK